MTNAFKLLSTHGVMKESDYKTTNTQNKKCSFDQSKAIFNNISGYTKIAPNQDGLTNALLNGPVSIGVDAGGIAWQLYFGGIIKNGGLMGCKTSPLDHGVVAVGYDSEKWIVRNSWGASWGNKGYVYLNRSNGDNTCGLFTDANVPDLK